MKSLPTSGPSRWAEYPGRRAGLGTRLRSSAFNFFSTATNVISDLLKPEKWLTNVFLGPKTKTGQHVGPITSLSIAAHWACIRCVAEDLGKIPSYVVRLEQDGDVEILYDHPAYYLLMYQANPFMSAMTFKELLQHWAGGWGNGYAVIDLNGLNEPTALWPVHPSNMQVIIRGGQPTYRVRGFNGKVATISDYSADQIFHHRGPTFDGIEGYSPVRLFAETLGVSLAAREFSANFFGNGSQLGGILSYPGELDEPSANKIRESWMKKYSGSENSHGVAVLEDGMTFTPTSCNPEESQFLESRQFETEEICRIHRVPPHKIQHLLRSTFSNIEQQSIEYVKDCLLSWTARWSNEVKMKLVNTNDRDVMGLFDLSVLLAGDTKTRGEFYKVMFDTGAFSTNDIRRKEGMKSIGEAGDKHFIQLNYTTLEDAAKPQAEKKVVPPTGLPKQLPKPVKEEVPNG